MLFFKRNRVDFFPINKIINLRLYLFGIRTLFMLSTGETIRNDSFIEDYSFETVFPAQGNVYGVVLIIEAC